ncbi:MAG: hypothetical protein EDM74_09670 [Armatimonadetes bacterium]|nr:MAG: hypothetical protein EDM74_09670 [Armatimonadota bacterium]
MLGRAATRSLFGKAWQPCHAGFLSKGTIAIKWDGSFRMTETQKTFLMTGIVCASAASVVLGVGVRDAVDLGLTRSGADTVASKQLLASRAVQTEIPEGEYFDQLAGLLKREFVDPIDDDLMLASGAIRGMVLSLQDPTTIYMDAKDLPVYRKALSGQFEGIGAELVFEMPPTAGPQPIHGADAPPAEPGDLVASGSRVPRVLVTYVVPNGPADKAGVEPGDWVEAVDGHWVVDAETVDLLRMTQQKVQSGEWPVSKLDELRKDLREKTKKSITPARAMQRLSTGSGAMSVSWHRGERVLPTQIVAGPSRVAPVTQSEGGSLRVRLAPGVPQMLAETLKDRKEVTLDFRGASVGSWEIAKGILEVLVPAGSYGELIREDGKPPIPVTVAKGASAPYKLGVQVDAYTRGAPGVLASLLVERAGATLISGSLPQEPIAVEWKTLPNGSGYTLGIGKWKARARASSEVGQ